MLCGELCFICIFDWVYHGFVLGVLIILHESVDAMTRLANISSLTPPLSLTISVMINFEYYNEDDYNDMKFMCFYF